MDGLLWEKHPGEPDIWFDRFTRYARPLGKEYTPKRAYTIYRLELARKGVITVLAEDAYPLWVDTSAIWFWTERAAAWAEEDQKITELMWMNRRRELLEEDWGTSTDLRGFAKKVLDRMEIHEVIGKDAAGNTLLKVSVRPGELAQMLKTASDLGRLAVGEPTTLSGGAQPGVGIYLPAIVKESNAVQKGIDQARNGQLDGDRG